MMRIGITLPIGGPAVNPANLSKIGKKAEALGFHSLWTYDRLLYAVEPRNPYGGKTPWPDLFKHTADPLDTLTFIAAQTEQIALGTSVLNAPFYNPVLLARRLTTIDVLSNGRLKVGLGLGWSEDEFTAVGVPMKQRGRRMDEFLTLLKAIWTENPASFAGEFYQLPPSFFHLKPVQKPHPPIYLGTFNARGLKRAATLADGWNPSGIGIEQIQVMGDQMRSFAAEAGRDPSELGIVLRTSIQLTDAPVSQGHHLLRGTVEQVQADLRTLAEAGVDEIIAGIGTLGTTDGLTLDDYLARLEQISYLLY
jgi:probable F420-dependent oxidoreductase